MVDEATKAILQAACPGVTMQEFRGDSRAIIPRDRLFDVCRQLKERGGFDLFVDVTCVDYLHYRDAIERFGLAYLLTCTGRNERLTLRVYLGEHELHVPSMTPLWEGANWPEREVFDMFGIVFDGHPNLKRILMPFEYTAFPLRKDYPLQGRGERHNFPVITRGRS